MVSLQGNDITLVAYQPALQPRERKSFEIVFREVRGLGSPAALAPSLQLAVPDAVIRERSDSSVCGSWEGRCPCCWTGQKKASGCIVKNLLFFCFCAHQAACACLELPPTSLPACLHS